MGRPKSEEVEAVEKIIENMYNVGKLTAQTKPRDVAEKLPPAVAKKMENRISPILKAAKERFGVSEAGDKSSDWRKEMKRLSTKVDELGGKAGVEALVTEAESLDQRLREIEQKLRSLGGVSGAKQVLDDLDAVVKLFKAAG
jgi:hypothetical protein